MTVERAIEVLEYSRGYEGMNFGAPKIALDMAISALEEIQQYRAIGKVEEVQWMISTYNDMMHDFGDDMLALKEYRAIGTVSEFRELKEKATAKKPYYVQYETNPNDINYHCPTCNRFVLYTHPICSCGQKLDWSEGKE